MIAAFHNKLTRPNLNLLITTCIVCLYNDISQNALGHTKSRAIPNRSSSITDLTLLLWWHQFDLLRGEVEPRPDVRTRAAEQKELNSQKTDIFKVMAQKFVTSLN